MSARTLAQWLDYIGRQHPDAIALGLDRVRAVYQRLGVTLNCPVITVGGTNLGPKISMNDGIATESDVVETLSLVVIDPAVGDQAPDNGSRLERFPGGRSRLEGNLPGRSL